MGGDNRSELIKEYRRKIIEAINIEPSPEQVAVIDNILLYFWHMGLLPFTERRADNE